MIAFIDDHRGAYGVEPICKVLPIAPSTYFDHRAKQADPARLSARARRDSALRSKINLVFEQNLKVYGARKVWLQMNREGVTVIVVTHEAEVAAFASRVIRFRDGRIVSDIEQAPRDAAAAPDSTRLGRLYSTAVGLTLTNPMTIMAFVAIFAGAGLIAQPGTGSAVLLTVGVERGLKSGARA